MATEAERLLEQIRSGQQTPAQRMLADIQAADTQPPPAQDVSGATSVVKNILGGAEAIGAVGTGLVGQVGAGIAGIGRAATGGDLSEVADIIKRTQDALTFEPKSEEGKRILASIGETLQGGVRLIEAGVGGGVELASGKGVSQAAETIEQIRERGAGDVVMERTGSPGLATAAELGVDVAFLSPGLRTARGGTPKAPSTPAPRTKLTGSERDVVKVLAEDALPEAQTPFRGFAQRRQQKLDALNEARLTAQQLGEGAKIADVGGPNTRGLAQVQGSVSREGQFLREQIVTRDAKVRDNMIGVLDETMFKGRTLKQTTDDIDVKMREDAAPLYREAYAEPVTLTPELTAKLSEPAVLDGIKEARNLLRIEPTVKSPGAGRGLTLEQKRAALSMFEKTKDGFVVNLDNASMLGLDYLKRGMDDVVQRVATKKQKSQEGTSRSLQAAEFRDVLVTQNAKYGEALSAWSTGMRAKDAVESGRTAFKSLQSNAKSVETLMEEFNALPVNEQSLYRVGAADFLRAELRRKPNLRTGETPPSVFTSFAGSPAHKQLLSTIFEDADAFRKFERLTEIEGVFGDTLKAVNVGDARQVALQQAFALGELPQVIAGVGTDALFAASANRFAVLNLIQSAFTKPRQFMAKFRSPGTARVTLGADAKTALNEMIGVLEGQQQMSGVTNRMKRVAKLPPEKLFNWLKDAKNRRKVYAFGTAAAVAEEAGLEGAP